MATNPKITTAPFTQQHTAHGTQHTTHNRPLSSPPLLRSFDQIAYGFACELEDGIGPYDQAAMTLFDYRTDHFEEGE